MAERTEPEKKLFSHAIWPDDIKAMKDKTHIGDTINVRSFKSLTSDARSTKYGIKKTGTVIHKTDYFCDVKFPDTGLVESFLWVDLIQRRNKDENIDDM